MSAEDMSDYKEFPTKESALDWLDNYLSLDERNNLIRALQQEPKTGHWIEMDGFDGDIYYECSNCGMAMGIYDVKNYCPNCGSRNVVEEQQGDQE